MIPLWSGFFCLSLCLCVSVVRGFIFHVRHGE